MSSAATDDYVAVRRLQDAYADVCSRRAWAELPDLLLDDVHVALDLRDQVLEIDGATAVADFIEPQLEQFSFFQFVIRNAVVDLYPGGDIDAAAGRMWMSEFRQHRADERWSTIFGVYDDRYRRTSSGWRIEARRYQTLARPDVNEAFDYRP